MKNNVFKSPIASKSVVDRIIDEITSAIIDGSLKPGDKIPTEMELCESFQVGRNSVREAIKILEAFGVVYIKRAEGTFVSSSFNKRMLDSMLYGLILQKESTDDIVELRRVFDIGVWFAAFEKMNEEKLKKIKTSLKEMEETIKRTDDMETVLDSDLQFHRVITECTENPLLVNMYEYITRLTIPSRKKATRRIFDTGNREIFISLHEEIVNMFVSNDRSKILENVKKHYIFWKDEK